ncbi:uncharacterized protein LOC121784268 [Salvia splendens]|uniref:uncharacterized protein LOC121784268 n=1 Tax=Salvia splendens TaxID=180675 RepID=UPI001C2636D4|nr:uncharacterized protein LOC121784268 [Salvia splendens]
MWQVQMYVRNGMVNGSIKSKHWKGIRLYMSTPECVERRRTRPFVVPVKWHPPDQPWVKLNMDGAYNEVTGKAGGGRVVRDASGKLLVAFATPLDAHSALEAELMAIYHGVELAKECMRPIRIESNSAQVVKLFKDTHWARRTSAKPWRDWRSSNNSTEISEPPPFPGKGTRRPTSWLRRGSIKIATAA